MRTDKITLNFNEYPELREDIQKIGEEGLNQLIQNIELECSRCRVNKPYTKMREGFQFKNFEIILKIGQEERSLLAGNWNDFHKSLINEVVSKFFYNRSLGFNITPDAFDFIRRVPIDEWKKIAKLIKESPPLSPDQIEAFKKEDVDHPIFQEKEWPSLALKAYFLNEIDRDKISALLLYDTSLQYYPETTQSLKLIDETGKINQEALDMLLFFASAIGFREFSDEKIEELKRYLKEFSLDNDRFFTIKVADLPKSIAMPPPFLINLLLKVKFGENAIRLNPVLGNSIRDDFTHKTYRDGYITCRYLPLPEYIHEVSTAGDPFYPYSHDIVHVIVESMNLDRVFWLEMAAEMEKRDVSPKVLELVLDRDFQYTNRVRNVSVRQVFEKLFDKLERFPMGEARTKIIDVLINFILEQANNSEHKIGFLQAVVSNNGRINGQIYMKLIVKNKIGELERAVSLDSKVQKMYRKNFK